jgi:hypothetical protein
MGFYEGRNGMRVKEKGCDHKGHGNGSWQRVIATSHSNIFELIIKTTETMNNISQLIGNTPLVDLSTFSHNKKVKIFGKLEGQNPGGSVKDRAALSMIERAIERGDIARGDQLVEATSGNTGIALAMIAATKGLKLTLIMPDSATPERIKSMKAYGADVILTPAAKSIEYSREMAEEMAASGSHYLLNQFANPDNPWPIIAVPARKYGSRPRVLSRISFLLWEPPEPSWEYPNILKNKTKRSGSSVFSQRKEPKFRASGAGPPHFCPRSLILKRSTTSSILISKKLSKLAERWLPVQA